MVDITEISAIVAATGVLVGVAYHTYSMRNQARIRKTEMLTRLYSSGPSSKEFMDAFWKVSSLKVKDYQEYVKQYGSLLTDSPMNRAFFLLVTYYELMGILLYRKLVDIITVYDVWGISSPLMLFEKIKPVVSGFRREMDDPAILVGFEYLCEELKRNELQLKRTWGKYTSDDPNSQRRGVNNG